ncbi:MAG: efflux RND transporter periplasmic adaptor subunit [Proteobacteria bacterium]|nr:efflux RND transporter periplasmic adaptor subunit [Pseudomonadota bacterium]
MTRLIILILVLSLAACGSAPGDDKNDGKNIDKKSEDSSQVDKKKDAKKKNVKGRKGKKGKNGEDDEEVIINVEATTIKLGIAASVFRTTTILEADLESAVTSKASGIVLQIQVEVGDKVEAGDVLAVLESDVQQLRYESANANYQKSQNNYQRAKSLLKKGLVNKESVENLKFETRSLKTSLSQAKLELDFTKITAPISGIITKRSIKKGNLIQLNTQVYEIVDFDSLQAVINVPEYKWRLFKKGLDVNFKFTGFDQAIIGSVIRVDPIVDSATGTFKVVMNIDKSQELMSSLRPGLFGKTEIILDQRENTLLVSKNAVAREDQSAYVYQVNDDNSVTKRVIVIGYEMDDDLEILSGIEVDKQVVTTGKNNVSEESTVEVIQYND